MAIRDISKIDCSQISEAQIGACHKIFEGSTPVYKVANSEGKANEDGEIIEYTVRWSKDKGFTCTCKAGQFGTLCWHVKASVACAREEKAAVAELQAAIAAQAVKAPGKVVTTVDAATLARVQAASEAPKKVSRAKAPTSKPFSLLR